MIELISTKGRGDQNGAAEPVAVYVRMSTDKQRYSTENQRNAIREYAQEHGMEIVRIFADEGKSGLDIEGREALKSLIHEVQHGKPSYRAILVYDISRWGRFQDTDQSAYYEYLCRRAGIKVVYCAEPFDNDGSPTSVIMKSIKRAMAAEFSRELSAKVFIGHCRSIGLGFHQGGSPGFGMRRVLLNDQSQRKGELQPGERKSIQTDRVILAPGSDRDVSTVRSIYRQFVECHLPVQAIADALNAAGVRTDVGNRWSHTTVRRVLKNERYIGNNVYNRTSLKLHTSRIRNPTAMWIRVQGAFDPVVEPEVFEKANALIAERASRLDGAVMLDHLRQLYKSAGTLSAELINEQKHMVCAQTYRVRFGSLIRAYSLVGFEPHQTLHGLTVRREMRQRFSEVIAKISQGFADVGGTVERNSENDLLTINAEFTASIVVSPCRQTRAGGHLWRIRFDMSPTSDMTIVARMAPRNEYVLDYYIFPAFDIPAKQISLTEENDLRFDAYRFDALDALFSLAARVSLTQAA
jgi:DNA invertase Pin-like site-specific DNA recombinase